MRSMERGSCGSSALALYLYLYTQGVNVALVHCQPVIGVRVRLLRCIHTCTHNREIILASWCRVVSLSPKWYFICISQYLWLHGQILGCHTNEMETNGTLWLLFVVKSHLHTCENLVNISITFNIYYLGIYTSHYSLNYERVNLLFISDNELQS